MMPKQRTWVVKLGGAMMATASLPRWLDACCEAGSNVCCVVVAGGGAQADHIRALQRRWHFDDVLAHQLAINAMAQNAAVLTALAPDAVEFSDLEAVPGRDRPCLIWRPDRTVSVLDAEASWRVTSDSLALLLARHIGADAVILVKSVSAGDLSVGSVEEAVARGLVDRALPSLLAGSGVRLRLMSKSQHRSFSGALERGVECGVELF